MRKLLTDAMLKKLAAPTSGRLEIFDSVVPNMAVRVTGAGAKSFVVRARIKGRRQPIRVTIGDVRAIKLRDARNRASAIVSACSRGEDPREQIRLEKVEAERADHLRFEKVVETFIDKHAKKNRTWHETELLFASHVTPRWRGRLITEVRRDDIVALLDRIEENVSVYRANKTLAAIRKMMNWAVLRGLIPTSPIVQGMAREGEEARTRFLSFDEIRLMWDASDRIGHPFGRLYQFLLVTGQRRGEAANARWASFDLKKERLWTLDPEETKAGREHFVPLSDLATEILAGLPRIVDPLTKEAIFTFTTAGRVPISTGGKSKEQLDAAILAIMQEAAKRRGDDPEKVKPLPEWRIHDLRRSAATHMEDALGIPPHIVGSVLNHSPTSYKGVTAVYTRGDLIYERRRALTAWARLLKVVIGREGAQAWEAVAKIIRPATEAEAARTAEFRRMIQTDDAAWAQYLKSVTRPANGKLRIAG